MNGYHCREHKKTKYKIHEFGRHTTHLVNIIIYGHSVLIYDTLREIYLVSFKSSFKNSSCSRVLLTTAKMLAKLKVLRKHVLVSVQPFGHCLDNLSVVTECRLHAITWAVVGFSIQVVSKSLDPMIIVRHGARLASAFHGCRNLSKIIRLLLVLQTMQERNLSILTA